MNVASRPKRARSVSEEDSFSREAAARGDDPTEDFPDPSWKTTTPVPVALTERAAQQSASLNAPPHPLDTPTMGGFRKAKPVLYLLMTCGSLYSATRLIEPILALKENGLGAQSANTMLQGVMGSKVRDELAKQLPPGTDLPDLSTLLSGGGIAASSTDAAPPEPREIIVRDVRYVDSGPRANRELFTQAMQLQSKGELDKAARIYEQILATDPDDTGVHRNLAVLYCQQQRYTDSWKHVHALHDLGRDMPEGFLKVLAAAMPDPGT